MNNCSTCFQKLTLAFCVLASLPLIVQAQSPDYSRAGKPEFYVLGQYWTGSNIRNATGPGFGIGYNLTEHANVNLEGYVGDLDVKINGVNGVGTTFVSTINLDYNFLKSRFTPLVTLGAGVFNYDARDHEKHPLIFNVADTGACYGGGAGLRYEVSRHWFMKAEYRVFGTSVSGMEVVHGPDISVGWKF